MKKLFLLLALAAAAAAGTDARELVVTLKDGTRHTFHLSATERVVMQQTEDGFTLNGTPYQTAGVAELRIFKDAPEGAVTVGLEKTPADTGRPDRQASVHDLSGRSMKPVGVAQLRPGIYIINRKKVVIR